MSLESFFGMEGGGEGMSSEALEKLQERMREAAAQIAAIRREEKRHKQKEDELIKILLHFVRTSHKTELILLISRALEENIPANFILAIILLGNEEIQKQVGARFLLPEGMGEREMQMLNAGEMATADDKSLIFFSEKDESMPLKVKIELDAWIKSLIAQAEDTPQKLIKTVYKIEFIEEESDNYFYGEKKVTQKKSIKHIIIQLAAYIINEYLNGKGIEENFETTRNFAQFIITGIVQKTEESLDQRKMIG